MKDRLILFVIGLLVGAVISTGAFFVYSKATNSCKNNQNMQMQGGQPPSMPNGQNSQDSQGGQPPEKPNDDNNQNSSSNSTNTKDSSN